MNTKTYKIKGMNCPHCAATVKKVFENFPEIEEGNVSLEKAQATVTFKERVEFDNLQTALANAGEYELFDNQNNEK